MIPRATYRVQFHRDFPFEAALPLASYLRRLGISHLYSSPILKAREGSVHGYDVIDHASINPELGGEDGFRRLAAELRTHGIGVIVDIVPNHMAVDEGNRWWWDVLEHGRQSRFAEFFDIDWNMLDGKVLLATLGKPYWETLQAGELRLEQNDEGKSELRYFDRRFPLRPEDGDLNLAEVHSVEALHAVIQQQHYRLAWWRIANDTINWRRFFDVPDLIALKQDTDGVFEASHNKIFQLCAEGLIDGVRVDHIDGLADPASYCRRLRSCLKELGKQREPVDNHPYIVVEKILGTGERLPTDWGVDGTTGYDFMNQVSALQHDNGGAEPLNALWHRISGRTPDFEPEEILARGEISQSSFESALSRTADGFFALSQDRMRTREITHAAVRRALVRILQHLRVYRTYATGTSVSPSAGSQFQAAMRAAQDGAGEDDRAAITFIAAVLGGGAGEAENRTDAVRRFNQLSAPVAAKAVEDTAFYRYARLLSRTDVGFDPGLFSLRIAEFHEHMLERAKHFPHSLLATATHDHKRGEDVRARLAVLSEIPEEWRDKVESWCLLNAQHRPASLNPADEYQLYQTILGAWPLELAPDDGKGLSSYSDRILAWQEKALREAKLRSSWLDPNAGYEAAAQDFARAILDPARSSAFLSSMRAFVGRIAPGGALNGFVQTALRCTVPGVPDCYQGAEFWDFSLVDPDNRRPVDYEKRLADLAGEPDRPGRLADWRDGRPKQALLAALLNLRGREPELFASGAYEPVKVRGERAGHVLAFVRNHAGRAVLLAVPLHVGKACRGEPQPDAAFWQGTELELPGRLADRTWRPLFGAGDKLHGCALGCAALFSDFPVAILCSD